MPTACSTTTITCPSCHCDPCIDGTGCSGTAGWRRSRIGGLILVGAIETWAVSSMAEQTTLAEDFRRTMKRGLRRTPGSRPRDQPAPRSMAKRWHSRRKR